MATVIKSTAYKRLLPNLDRTLFTILFFLPCRALFTAFLNLGNVDKDHPRPYKGSGGRAFVWIMAVFCVLAIIQVIVCFIWELGSPFDWRVAAPILTGVVITLSIGEILIPLKALKKMV